MTQDKVARMARMEKALRMKEELATIERLDAESRLANIIKSQDIIQEGNQSIFALMASGLYAEVATYSMVGASERERKTVTALQSELKQLRGMRKALNRIHADHLQNNERSGSEKVIEELGARTAQLNKSP